MNLSCAFQVFELLLVTVPLVALRLIVIRALDGALVLGPFLTIFAYETLGGGVASLDDVQELRVKAEVSTGVSANTLESLEAIVRIGAVAQVVALYAYQ